MKFRIGIEEGLERPPEGYVVKDEYGNRIGTIRDYFKDDHGALWANVDLDQGIQKPESNIIWYTKENREKRNPFCSEELDRLFDARMTDDVEHLKAWSKDAVKRYEEEKGRLMKLLEEQYEKLKAIMEAREAPWGEKPKADMDPTRGCGFYDEMDMDAFHDKLHLYEMNLHNDIAELEHTLKDIETLAYSVAPSYFSARIFEILGVKE